MLDASESRRSIWKLFMTTFFSPHLQERAFNLITKMAGYIGFILCVRGVIDSKVRYQLCVCLCVCVSECAMLLLMRLVRKRKRGRSASPWLHHFIDLNKLHFLPAFEIRRCPAFTHITIPPSYKTRMDVELLRCLVIRTPPIYRDGHVDISLDRCRKSFVIQHNTTSHGTQEWQRKKSRLWRNVAWD